MSSPTSAVAPTATSPDDWLRVPAAAQSLATSKRTLYRLARERKVPFRRLPGTAIVAFAPEDIEAIKAAAAVPPLRGLPDDRPPARLLRPDRVRPTGVGPARHAAAAGVPRQPA